MDPTEDVVAALASDQSKAQLSADYFGPVVYLPGELFPSFVFLSVLSLFLLIASYVLPSMLTHSGIVIAQFHKVSSHSHREQLGARLHDANPIPSCAHSSTSPAERRAPSSDVPSTPAGWIHCSSCRGDYGWEPVSWYAHNPNSASSLM